MIRRKSSGTLRVLMRITYMQACLHQFEKYNNNTGRIPMRDSHRRQMKMSFG